MVKVTITQVPNTFKWQVEYKETTVDGFMVDERITTHFSQREVIQHLSKVLVSDYSMP